MQLCTFWCCVKVWRQTPGLTAGRQSGKILMDSKNTDNTVKLGIMAFKEGIVLS